MNKFIKRLNYIAVLVLAIAATSCSDDIADEIKTLETSRLFSPTNIETRIVNQTGVRISWKAVNKAKSYNIEVYDNGDENFEGSPVKTATGITFDQTPYTITGFDGETKFSMRIQAIGEDIADSKWTSATFKTDPEQIFYQVDLSEVLGTQATLRWPAGQTATHISVTPGDITYTVTANDIAAGAATITGLNYDTKYTAKLMNGEKTRGTTTFTTRPDGTPVTPEDNLAELIAASEEGEKFVLKSGVHIVDQDIAITHSIIIKGEDLSNKPIIQGAIFRMKTGAGLELGGVIFDGTNSKDGNQMIVYDEDGTNAPLFIENCTIKNYTKGTLYVNKATNIESVTIKGCTYTDVECSGGDFIDFRNGLTPSFEFTNNTAYNSALARDFFRMDAGGSNNFPGVKSVINISNNTFYKVSNGSNRRILYIRLASHEITFNKNILADTEGYYTNQASTTIKEMADNNYHNAPNFTGSAQSNAQNDAGKYTTFNPGFKDADNGDFTLSNEELKENKIGDQRWW